MSYVKSFTVGNLTVNAKMASAVQQDEMLSLLSSALIQRAAIAGQNNAKMGTDILVPMFMSMPQQLKRQVVSSLAGTVMVHGTESLVTVNDFSGKMVEWNTLLAQLLLWNFEGFFDWLESAVKDVPPAPPVEQAV